MQQTPRWSYWAEGTLIVAVIALSVQEAGAANRGDFTGLPVAAALVAGSFLTLRTRWPLPVAALSVIAAGGWGLMLPLLVMLFHLAAHRRTKEAAGAAVVAMAANALVHPVLSLWETRSYGPALPLVLAVVLGLWASNRRRLVYSLNSEVQHLRTERNLREQAARLTERTAIAAEMHDVLAHRLSLIALHTGALKTRKDLPIPVSERIDLLRTASTDALTDLRDVLGALRNAGQDPRVPALALRDVREVIEQARAAGQKLKETIDDDPLHAPATYRLAVLRVVQEALSNTRKHAHEAPVEVTVRYGPPTTKVVVVNPAGTPAEDAIPSGFGLVGLRERIEALGGHLDAGPDGAGSWRLSACIPHSSHSGRWESRE